MQTVSTRLSTVQPTVRMPVHARDHVYLLSLRMVLYASKFQPLGQRNTSLRIRCSLEDRELASTLTIGSRQIIIVRKMMKAMMKSPTRVFWDLIMP